VRFLLPAFSLPETSWYRATLTPSSPTDDTASTKPLYTVPTIKEYFQDLDEVLSVISDGPAKSFAWRRLRYLESKWNLYVLLNEYRELAEMKRVSHRDFYNVRKVRFSFLSFLFPFPRSILPVAN
jgi:hypothetical protein